MAKTYLDETSNIDSLWVDQTIEVKFDPNDTTRFACIRAENYKNGNFTFWYAYYTSEYDAWVITSHNSSVDPMVSATQIDSYCYPLDDLLSFEHFITYASNDYDVESFDIMFNTLFYTGEDDVANAGPPFDSYIDNISDIYFNGYQIKEVYFGSSLLWSPSISWTDLTYDFVNDCMGNIDYILEDEYDLYDEIANGNCFGFVGKEAGSLWYNTDYSLSTYQYLLNNMSVWDYIGSYNGDDIYNLYDELGGMKSVPCLVIKSPDFEEEEQQEGQGTVLLYAFAPALGG